MTFRIRYSNGYLRDLNGMLITFNARNAVLYCKFAGGTPERHS